MIHICVLGEPGNEANSNYAILCRNAKSQIEVSTNASLNVHSFSIATSYKCLVMLINM